MPAILCFGYGKDISDKVNNWKNLRKPRATFPAHIPLVLILRSFLFHSFILHNCCLDAWKHNFNLDAHSRLYTRHLVGL